MAVDLKWKNTFLQRKHRFLTILLPLHGNFLNQVQLVGCSCHMYKCAICGHWETRIYLWNSVVKQKYSFPNLCPRFSSLNEEIWNNINEFFLKSLYFGNVNTTVKKNLRQQYVWSICLNISTYLSGSLENLKEKKQ